MNSTFPTRRPFQERHFTASDGVQLFYRHWPAVTGEKSDTRAVLLFHRGHKHGARMAHLVDELDLPDCSFFAWDARGLGKSPGERGYAASFGTIVKDVDSFVRHIDAEHGIPAERTAIIAQSVGAVVVATWVHDYAPAISSMVLASPAFKVKLYVPLARQSLALMQKFRNKFFVNSYVKAKFLTHDEARIASYETDPLITRPIAVNILLGLYEAAERVIDDAGAIHVPTQLLVSGADWVVHHKPQHEFMRKIGSSVKESHVFDGFFHDTLGEKDRHLAVAKARAFVLRNFEQPQAAPALQQAHQRGMTHDEYQRLSQPPSSALARAYWAMSRFWIGVGSHFSSGLKLSSATGFDSGSTLDYVYRNQSQGVTPLGKLVDRIYLNSIGWRGIRQRKIHLERMIARAASLLGAQPLRVVDIAAGHGRYILDALTHLPTNAAQPLQITLRDYSKLNVEAGQRLIAEKGLQHCARFEAGDAFDRNALANLNPRPTLAVVSGLYELFADNALIEQSLAGLAQALDSGSYLIYTNQPWHPQLELIARSLTSHREGQAWVMRRRTQAEMDQLVAAAGFVKLDQFSDEWGIFSVSLARRV
jgi:alpha-beta hydrolase superfamily lysophospholipase